MKKKLSIDRIGTRGSIALLVLGIFCLLFGSYLQIKNNQLPSDAVEITAEISGFQNTEDSTYQSPFTLVTYTIDGKTYSNIPLGQYEGSWKVGGKVNICCNNSNPTHIWTRTMQYQGIFYILFSISFLIVAIYKLFQFRKVKGVNEHESDLDESGREKFKISSFILPFSAGIPFTVSGIIYWFMEHSVFGIAVAVLGFAAVLTGIFSLIDFIQYKKSASIRKIESGKL